MFNVRNAKVSDALEIARVHIDTRRITYKEIIPEEYLLIRSYNDVAKMWKDRISNPDSSEIILITQNNNGEF